MIRRLASLEPDERARLLRRSLDQIFEPLLWTQIEAIYEDVELAGDSAVCAALDRAPAAERSSSSLSNRWSPRLVAEIGDWRASWSI